MLLNAKELETQTCNILEFLKLVHPGLEDDRLAIEIRPIQRGEYSYKQGKSLTLWRYDKKSVSFLRKFLEKHNGESNCLYYSVFRYDTDVKAITAAGKEAKPGKITSMAARLSETIVFDFDHIKEDERRKLVIQFEKEGLELTWVFTGNGYHGLLHLSEVLRDNRLIKLLVNYFNDKGFNIDENCVDTARVMRLPYTHNYKNIKDPIPTELISVSNERYSIDYLFALLGKFPKEELDKEKKDLKVLSDYDLPEPIKQMLTFVPAGFRNSTLGFLVGFLKTNLGFGHKQLYTIMNEWAKEACSPAYPGIQFRSDFDRFYFSGALQYSSELTKQFGYIDFEAYASLRKQHYLYLNTEVFDLAETPGELRAFLMIKLLEHGGEKGYSIHDLIDWSEMNLRYSKNGLTINTIRRDLKNGLKSKLLYRKYGNKKAGEPDLYYSNQLFSLSSGHYLLPANDADVFLSSLNLNQLKLYLYLSYLQSFGVKFISQQKLADDLGVSRPRISTLIKELEKLRFIKVDRQRYGNAVRFCTYTLLR